MDKKIITLVFFLIFITIFIYIYCNKLSKEKYIYKGYNSKVNNDNPSDIDIGNNKWTFPETWPNSPTWPNIVNGSKIDLVDPDRTKNRSLNTPPIYVLSASDKKDNKNLNISAGLPLGSIIILNAGAAMPKGWHLCNDVGFVNNIFVPNLIDKFILGAGSSKLEAQQQLDITRDYIVGNQGGEKRHILTTEEMASHLHGQSIGYNGIEHKDTRKGDGITEPSESVLNSFEADTNRGGGIGPEFETVSHENLPPYMKLRYIIKVE